MTIPAPSISSPTGPAPPPAWQALHERAANSGPNPAPPVWEDGDETQARLKSAQPPAASSSSLEWSRGAALAATVVSSRREIKKRDTVSPALSRF